MASPLDDWHRPLSKSIRKPAFAGMTLFALLFGGFGVWASTAPLASAVVARGTFVATGQNKFVQHLEGGVIREILVREGELVVEGQPLVLLDETSAKAEVRRLEIKRAGLIAALARLDAERTDSATVTFPKELTDLTSDAEIAHILETQRTLFKARHDERMATLTISERQVSAIQQEIVGLNAQKQSSEQQLALFDQEVAQQEQLYASGLSQLSKILMVKRNKSKVEGDIGQLVSEIGRAEQRILENQSQLAHDHRKFIEDAVEEYRQNNTDLEDSQQRLTSARAVLARTTILAPVTGVIVKLNYHTSGGVIGAGQQVLEILPTGEKLLVEAFIRPDDRDSVAPGLDAELRLTAFNQRTTPLVDGKVTYVSADKIEGKKENESYYLARITLDESSIAKLGHNRIEPGMPAEVFVKTGERTFFDYLMRPITDSMNRGALEN